MKSILREVILKKVHLSDKLFLLIDDYSIYTHFIGQDLELSQAIESPIRDQDDHPSFCLFLPTRVVLDRPDEIWFKDLADGRFGNVFQFVKHIAFHQYSIELNTRYEIIRFIDQQMQLGLFDKNQEPVSKRVERNLVHKDYDILYKSRPFTNNDLVYWDKYGIKESTLKKFKVKSIKYLLAEDKTVLKEFRLKDLAFVYEIWDKVKLYRPMEIKQFKFRNKCPGDNYLYYQGFEQLSDDYSTLLITKSHKDIMCFYELFSNLKYEIDLLAPHAESINLNLEFVKLIKKRYENRIFIVADFDLAGVKFVQQCRRLGLKNYRFVSTKRIMINEKLKVLDKDISDYRENHGEEQSLKLIKEWKLI
jgi:hypothetical protein